MELRLQRHRLVYLELVHCGGAFQTPIHYGTSSFDMGKNLASNCTY